MSVANSTAPSPLPLAPGTGPGPLGMPGGTDRSYQVDIIICAVATAIIGVIFVALRFYARRIIIHVLDWEDWLILVAQVGGHSFCAVCMDISRMAVVRRTVLTLPVQFFSIAMCVGFVQGTTFQAAPSNAFPLGVVNLADLALQRQSLAMARTHG